MYCVSRMTWWAMKCSVTGPCYTRMLAGCSWTDRPCVWLVCGMQDDSVSYDVFHDWAVLHQDALMLWPSPTGCSWTDRPYVCGLYDARGFVCGWYVVCRMTRWAMKCSVTGPYCIRMLWPSPAGCSRRNPLCHCQVTLTLRRSTRPSPASLTVRSRQCCLCFQRCGLTVSLLDNFFYLWARCWIGAAICRMQLQKSTANVTTTELATAHHTPSWLVHRSWQLCWSRAVDFYWQTTAVKELSSLFLCCSFSPCVFCLLTFLSQVTPSLVWVQRSARWDFLKFFIAVMETGFSCCIDVLIMFSRQNNCQLILGKSYCARQNL